MDAYHGQHINVLKQFVNVLDGRWKQFEFLAVRSVSTMTKCHHVDSFETEPNNLSQVGWITV
jgi:hypothetical protein